MLPGLFFLVDVVTSKAALPLFQLNDDGSHALHALAHVGRIGGNPYTMVSACGNQHREPRTSAMMLSS